MSNTVFPYAYLFCHVQYLPTFPRKNLLVLALSHRYDVKYVFSLQHGIVGGRPELVQLSSKFFNSQYIPDVSNSVGFVS